MHTKEEYYQLVLKLRDLVKKEEVLKCTCPSTHCEWHGRCKECVALHRYYGSHVPACLQPIINEKIEKLAAVGESSVVPKEKTPAEYWEYVREQDKNNSE